MNCGEEKRAKKERKKRWKGDDKNAWIYFVGKAGTGERGRTDKQMMF